MSLEELAKNPNTAPETLRELAQNENIDIRMTVAANPGIPLDLAQSFIDVGDEWIRMNVARYTPHLEILEKLVEDKSDMVREAVAKNSNAEQKSPNVSNIDKITSLLNSSNYEAGFELLITKNDSALNEAMVDIITKVVRQTYFYEIGDQILIDRGLEIMYVLFPLLSSLNLSYSYMENLEISKFTSLKVLNLEGCDCLENIDGIYNLNNLTNLNLKYTASLKNLDISKLNHIDEIIGFRDQSGMLIDENMEQFYWEKLDLYFDNEFQRSYLDYGSGSIEDHLNSNINIVIDESDLYDRSFDSNREVFEPLENYLSNEQIERLPILSEDEVAIFLFTDGFDFITSFHRHKDDFGEALD